MTASRGTFRKIIRNLASLKLAVVIIIVIGVVTAWGTIVEAQFDALAAKKTVYSSIWMIAPMVMLVVSLTAVMIDRWPWQRRHLGFILAHVGIIILLLGSLMTQKLGVDGSVSIGIGEKQGQLTSGETDLGVFASEDGSTFTSIFAPREIDFFLHPAAKEPITIPVSEGEIKIVDSYPYAIREQKFVEAEDPKSGAALRFQLQNPNVNMTEWMLQRSNDTTETKDLGPAQVLIVSKFPRDFGGRNAIVLRPHDGDKVEYNIHSARIPKVKKGFVSAGETIDTGWMGLQFRLLKYMYHAKEEVTYRPLEKPTPLTTAAIKLEYRPTRDAKWTTQWMGLNTRLKLFSDRLVYVVSYANRRLPLGFEMRLKDFKVGMYQGTTRAASYESVVEVSGLGERNISMNEPLKHAGLTFYQASFESDPATGKPVASILSVNHDPGRFVKYFGCLLIVFGAIHLFYRKRRAWMQKPTPTTTSGVT